MELVIVGMSHVEALAHGWDVVAGQHPGVVCKSYNLRRFLCKVADQETARFRFPMSEVERSLLQEAREAPPAEGTAIDGYVASAHVAERYGEFISDADTVAFLIDGNEHNIVGLVEVHTVDAALKIVANAVRRTLASWLDLLLPLSPGNPLVLLPPPPNGSDMHVTKRADRAFQAKLVDHPIRNPSDRLRIWQRQCEVTREVARERGLRVAELPSTVFSADGLLAEDCYGNDATHGNDIYGERVVGEILRIVAAGQDGAKPGHPYSRLPDSSYWRQAVSELAPGDVDPVSTPRFTISRSSKVATAGSCFAQHISRRLRDNGFNYFLAESPASREEGERRGFYDFSARYGNVYTSRQLLQLFDRAFGYFVPVDRVWDHGSGGFCDPFRPRIEPDGFPTRKAVLEDAERHLAAVRRMFSELDVFVFTLGLTECWRSRLDGAAYPLAPGVAGGRYDPARHEFVNLDVAAVVSDMNAFLDKLALVNPAAKVILTVSPVPLVATYEPRHVLSSTIYSKSVLRVAVEHVMSANGNVQYFPSYEIIVGPHATGGYFSSDRRGVEQAGVDHVMRIFMSRMTEGGARADDRASAGRIDDIVELREIRQMIDAGCDEEMYARPAPNGS